MAAYGLAGLLTSLLWSANTRMSPVQNSQETIGWSDDAMDQTLADFRVPSKELKTLGAA